MRKLKLALAVGLMLQVAPLPAADHHLIFLVDQSGSMWRAHGPNLTWRANDHPSLGYRIEVVSHTLEALQARLDFQRDASTRHTLYMVEFAGTVRDRQPLIASYDPANPAASAAALRAAKQKLEALKRPGGFDTDQTDTRAGLHRVLQIVDSLGGAASGTVHVLLITDGKPYHEQNGINVANSPGYQANMADLARRIRDRGADFEVFGLVGPEDRTQYWPQWGPFWRGVSDGTHRVDNPHEIPRLADSLVRKWLGLPQAVLAANPYFCPPYLKRIVFTVNKQQPGAQVEIRDASGRLLKPGVPDVHIVDERTYTRISVDRPMPGLWQLDRRAASIYVESFYRQIRRIQPVGATNVGIPLTFRYHVLSDTGEEFRELPSYPIIASVEVEEPGGTSRTLAAAHSGQGIFETDQPYQFSDNGSASLAFRGKTRLPNGDLVEVFGSRERLEVTARELLVLDTGESLPGHGSAWFGGFQLQPRLRLLRAAPSRTPVRPAEVSPSPGRLLESRLVRIDGEVPAHWPGWLPVLLDGESFQAEHEAAFRLLSWDWLLRRSQPLYFQVRVDESRLDSRFLIRDLRRAAEAEPAHEPLDESEVLPALSRDPLALPLSVREAWGSYLLVVAPGLLLVVAVCYGAGTLAVRAGFIASDKLFHQTVNVVVQQVGGAQETLKSMTGRRRLVQRKKGQVSITIGDWDDPDWQPEKLKIVRLFRPWTGRVQARLSYPVGTGASPKWHSTDLLERELPIRLAGVPEAEGYLVVRRKGRDTRDDS